MHEMIGTPPSTLRQTWVSGNVMKLHYLFCRAWQCGGGHNTAQLSCHGFTTPLLNNLMFINTHRCSRARSKNKCILPIDGVSTGRICYRLVFIYKGHQMDRHSPT